MGITSVPSACPRLFLYGCLALLLLSLLVSGSWFGAGWKNETSEINVNTFMQKSAVENTKQQSLEVHYNQSTDIETAQNQSDTTNYITDSRFPQEPEDISNTMSMEQQEILSVIYEANSKDKLELLNRLWQFAPTVGVSDDVLILLQLLLFDTDSGVGDLASVMQKDLQRLKDGVETQVQQLVNMIIAENNKSEIASRNPDVSMSYELHASADSNRTPAIPAHVTSPSPELDELKEIALNSTDINEKESAFLNVMQYAPGTGLEILEHQLLNSQNTDDRYIALEKLRAAIGSVNSSRLRGILEIAANDYYLPIAEYAKTSIVILDQYERVIKS